MRRKRFIASGLACTQEQAEADEALDREEAETAAAEAASKGKKAKKDDKKKAAVFKVKQIYELDDFGTCVRYDVVCFCASALL